MNYIRRIEVFNDTLKKIGTDGIPSSPEGRIYKEEIINQRKKENHFTVKVKNMDCLRCAQEEKKKYNRVTVLNMADRYVPGGAVLSGSGAQEEYICRCTNYYPGLFSLQSEYPLDCNFGAVYTRVVTVFKGTQEENYSLLEKNQRFQIDIIAVPAINSPHLERGLYTKKEEQQTKNKIQTILNVAVENETECLIAGAFGCGVFHNPPLGIAKLFKEVFEEVGGTGNLKEILFAIKEDSSSPVGGNYIPFLKTLNGLTF